MAEFDQIFANDPNNPQNVAENGVISIYAPGTRTLLALKTVTGGPLSNPLQLNSRGFGPAFIADGYTLVAWEAVAPGEVFNGTFKSYPGILAETILARTAAQTAAATAGAQAAAVVEGKLAAGDFKGDPGDDGKDGSNVVPTAQAIATEIQTPGTPANTALSATFASRRVQDAITKQSHLYGQFMKKLHTGVPVSICALGDSTTYGHDTVSADKVAAPVSTLPNGSQHATTRSPSPWPGVMGNHLTSVYPAGVAVINRGFSGDAVDRTFSRWITPSGADITIISLGINDATGTWIPNYGDVKTYVEGYEKLILREITDYNAAVVIMTPIKQRGDFAGGIIDVFRNALGALAAKYGVPIIDAEPFLAGHSGEVYSDSIHLNTAGNAIIGARMAAHFVGAGPDAPLIAYPGTRLSVRPTIDNVVYTGAELKGAAGGGGPSEMPVANGVIVSIPVGKSITYSFVTAVPDTIIFPAYVSSTGAALEVSLDFGSLQSDNILDELVSETGGSNVRASSFFTHTGSVNQTVLTNQAKVLRVAAAGWHTLTVRNTGTQSVQFVAVEFESYRGFYADRGGAYHLPVPPAYNESAPITSTRIKLADLMATLRIQDWRGLVYAAPAFKVTIRSYGQRVIEYLLTVTASPSTTTGGIESISQIRSTALATTPDEAKVREIETVTWDAATKELVFTWKAAGKNQNLNFVMDISVL